MPIRIPKYLLFDILWTVHRDLLRNKDQQDAPSKKIISLIIL